MQASEVAELLSLASAYDNRNVTREAAIGWKVAIDSQVPDLSMQLAREVVVEHFATSPDYFTVRHLIDGAKARLRRMPAQIAADVRSAKARGLIPKDYPHREPLPPAIVARLTEARTTERPPAELEAGENRSPLALDVGRRLN